MLRRGGHLGLCLLAAVAAAGGGRVALIEPDFGLSANQTARISDVVAQHASTSFTVLALQLWNGSFSPSGSEPLPAPDAGALSFTAQLRAQSPALRVWAGVSLCPGPAYACMLNHSQADEAGGQLAARVAAAGLQGAFIYVSPYCNNADCKRTTGKYAVGIARIVTAFRAAAPGLDIAMLLNEWDHPELVAAAGPTVVFSYQSVFYLTAVGDCQAQCGRLCGAGESAAYITRAGRNMSYVTEYMASVGVAWIGQLRGASDPEAMNPPDLWPALAAYSAPQPASAAASNFTFLAIGDWGGGGAAPFTQPGEVAVAAGMATVADAVDVAWVLALGDNMYPLGLCNNGTLAPYNNTCAARFDPRAGTVDDPRFQATFEAVFSGASLEATPWYVIAGNHDALGNVSSSIEYSAHSTRWRHPWYWYPVRASTGVGGTNERLDVLMLDVTLCYGIWSDPVHDAMCAQQLEWLAAELTASTADYLIVAGHYPVWSACAHGNTQWAIDALLPLMAAANVTMYASGHDHCNELLAPADPAAAGNDMVYMVTGTGDGCCYSASNVASVPPGSLKYLLAQEFNPTGELGGFASVSVTPPPLGVQAPSVMRVGFHGVNGTLLYSSPAMLARTRVIGPDGAVVSMAAPDYAAAGLLRPSAAQPAAPYA